MIWIAFLGPLPRGVLACFSLISILITKEFFVDFSIMIVMHNDEWLWMGGSLVTHLKDQINTIFSERSRKLLNSLIVLHTLRRVF